MCFEWKNQARGFAQQDPGKVLNLIERLKEDEVNKRERCLLRNRWISSLRSLEDAWLIVSFSKAEKSASSVGSWVDKESFMKVFLVVLDLPPGYALYKYCQIVLLYKSLHIS